MKIVSVRGMKPNDPSVVYVGRACAGWKGSPLGNSFKVGRDGSLREVLEKYRQWLWEQLQGGEHHLEVVEALAKIHQGSSLGCWCCDKDVPSPKGQERCHAEIIAKAWTWFQQLTAPNDDLKPPTENRDMLCSVCHKNWVDVNAGYDTCESCLVNV